MRGTIDRTTGRTGTPLWSHLQRRAWNALRQNEQPQIRLHLIEKAFETKPAMVLVSALGAIIVGGAAAWRCGDVLMGCLVALTVLAVIFVLPVIMLFPGSGNVDLSDAITWERFLFVPSLLLAAGLGLLCARSFQATSDTLVHMLTVSLVLGAVTTILRNYFRPKLVLSQLALLLIPTAVAQVSQGQPIYWVIALGTVGLGHNVIGITRSLYLDAVALLMSREQIIEQTDRLDAAVGNMSHGLCMFDREERLAVCNPRYLEAYGFSSDIVRRGITLREVVDYSCSLGNHELLDADRIYQYLQEHKVPGAQGSFDHRLSDGRILLITHKWLPDGGWVAVHEDITDQRAAEARIEYMAKYDALTGLPNRNLMNEVLDETFRGSLPLGRAALLLIDLDRFKSVNDTLGHPVGDEVLRHVAQRLARYLEPNDIIARLGGDEFAIVRRGPSAGRGPVEALATLLVATLQQPFDVADHRFVLGGCVGISFRSSETLDPSSLLRQSDLALYAAKNVGRGQFRIFTPEMDRGVQERRVLETGLRQALANGEFELVYQPIVDLRSKEVVCYEALLRWHSPDRGTLLPDEFIPLAEDIGVIQSIGQWALHEACREAATWPGSIKVAVNLSPVEFRSASLTSNVMMALARSGLAPERLELEITEGVLLKGTQATIATLKQLKEIGVVIALDDFGTGYSSLSYLRMFNFDKVKIDKSFVDELETSAEARAIVEAVITLSKRLRIISTAEGVETQAQLQQLKDQGCTQVQGYLLGKPSPAAKSLQETQAA